MKLNTVAPYAPHVRLIDVAYDHINVSWVPGQYDSADPRSPGTVHEFRFKPAGDGSCTSFSA